MEKLIDKIRPHLNRKAPQQQVFPLLSGQAYALNPFSTNNVHTLSGSGQAETSVAFIDGGHAILIDAPHLCVAFVRAHAVIYAHKEKITSKTMEGYLLVFSSAQNNDIRYTAEILSQKGNFTFESMLLFDSLDDTIRTGSKRFAPSSIAGVARRFAELQLATEITASLSSNDIVVLDGSLQKNYTNEQHLLSSLAQQGKKNEVIILGINKTNSLFASHGAPFSSLLESQGGSWYYAPIAQPLKGDPHLAFAKFHQRSNHILLVESFEPLKTQQYETMCQYSNDGVFLGYPYGLIEADRAARISKQEALYVQTRLQEKLGNSFEVLSSLKNAHSILDSISF